MWGKDFLTFSNVKKGFPHILNVWNWLKWISSHFSTHSSELEKSKEKFLTFFQCVEFRQTLFSLHQFHTCGKFLTFSWHFPDIFLTLKFHSVHFKFLCCFLLSLDLSPFLSLRFLVWVQLVSLPCYFQSCSMVQQPTSSARRVVSASPYPNDLLVKDGPLTWNRWRRVLFRSITHSSSSPRLQRLRWSDINAGTHFSTEWAMRNHTSFQLCMSPEHFKQNMIPTITEPPPHKKGKKMSRKFLGKFQCKPRA